MQFKALLNKKYPAALAAFAAFNENVNEKQFNTSIINILSDPKINAVLNDPIPPAAETASTSTASSRNQNFL